MAKILIVDDKESNLVALQWVLKGVDAEIVKALSGEDALLSSLNHDFALAILDVQMPAMDGYELATLLRGDERTRHVPIIFLSAVYITDPYIFKGYASGAVDFITKPFKPEILLSKVNVFLDLDARKLEIMRQKDSLEKLVVQLTEQIEARKRAEEQIKASLAEKEVLLKEVHHRVKNNLAAIMGLLNLQRQKMDDATARAALAELSVRIKSMAIVHEQLYKSENFSRINFQDYTQALIDHLYLSYHGRSADIHVKVAAKGVVMRLDNAVPCGLLLTELVTNALKFAFPEGRPRRPGADTCEIAVSAEWDGATYTLTVADNGVGLPVDLDWSNADTLGLLLVKMLGQHQLQGRIELDCSCGTSFRLRFEPRKNDE
ncbi:MAG: histidine kinase dimerization/phosphoacceptor domain -containing protein [Pseudomonadota bacterium]